MRWIAQGLGLVLVGYILGWTTPLSLHAEDGYTTLTFGASASHRYPGTLRKEGNVIRFDLSAIPSGTRIVRAVLAVPDKGHRRGVEVRVQANIADAKPLSRSVRPSSSRSTSRMK
jgi:hypothetical protein